MKRLLLGLIVIAAALMPSGCYLIINGGGGDRVRYEADIENFALGDMDVVYINDEGKSVREENVTSFSKEFKIGDGFFAAIAAEADFSTDEVTVVIYVDGSPVQSDVADGSASAAYLVD